MEVREAENKRDANRSVRLQSDEAIAGFACSSSDVALRRRWRTTCSFGFTSADSASMADPKPHHLIHYYPPHIITNALSKATGK